MEIILEIALGIVAFVVLIFVISLIKKGGKIKVKVELGWFKKNGLFIIFYILGIIYMQLQCPLLWHAWYGFPLFFWVTNAIVLIVLIFFKDFLFFAVLIIIVLIGLNYTIPRFAHSSHGTPAIQTIEKQEAKKVFYKFSASVKCISVYLKSETAFYPKGGKIIIKSPSGTTWELKPGEVLNMGRQLAGWFSVCQGEPSNYGVEVLN